MPFDRSRYPANWNKISFDIRFVRADSQCEWINPDGTRCEARHWDVLPGGRRVVLTCAHLGIAKPDGTPGDKSDTMDCRPENLAALCPKHHLLLDQDQHLANRRASHRRKQREAGQLALGLPEGVGWET